MVISDDEENARFDRGGVALPLLCLLAGLGMLGLCVHAGGIV